MENLNFLPDSFKSRYVENKIKHCKVFVVVMWLCCISLFMLYNFNSSRYKLKSSRESNSNSLAKASAQEVVRVKNIQSINTIRKFSQGLIKEVNYNKLSVYQDRMDLELTVKDKNQYYDTVNVIENIYGYKILSLSPLTDKDGQLEFKIQLEVR